MILVVNVCFEKLHYYEFVRPIEDILKKARVSFFTRYYLEIKNDDLRNCSKVIICGTSLKDNCFLKDIEKFFWLRDFDRLVFGICAGFQVLGKIFGGKIGVDKEIGFFRENFVQDFLGLSGEVEVYHLHKNYIDFPLEWKIYSGVDFAQAVKWKNFYGVLFHPEVRNKEMILEFCRL